MACIFKYHYKNRVLILFIYDFSDTGGMEIELFWKVKIRFTDFDRNIITFGFYSRKDPTNFNEN